MHTLLKSILLLAAPRNRDFPQLLVNLRTSVKALADLQIMHSWVAIDSRYAVCVLTR